MIQGKFSVLDADLSLEPSRLSYIPTCSLKAFQT